MLAMRRLWTVLAGASFGAILARTFLDWLLGLEGTWVDVAIPPSSAGERSPEAPRPLRA